MNYNQHIKKMKKLCDKLVLITQCMRSQEDKPHGMEDIPKPLERWFSNFFKDMCGIGIGETFKGNSLWASWHHRKANFKTYFRVDKVHDIGEDKEYPNHATYRVFLSTYNLEADTDMSDSWVIYIEYNIGTNYGIISWSFHYNLY